MVIKLHRPVCDLLGCTYPVVLAGMGGVARSELVRAVTEAGGFGFPRHGAGAGGSDSLGSGGAARAENRPLRRQSYSCRDRRRASRSPGLCVHRPRRARGWTLWDVSLKLVARLRAARIIVACQVGSRAEAQAVEQAGAQIIIAQGVEAGGHVRGDRPLHDLLPEIVAETALPVLAAGGLADGADLATVLSLGAQGAVFGTALVATPESYAHDYHKQRLVDAEEGDTVLTDAFHINWPRGAKTRVLANSVIAR